MRRGDRGGVAPVTHGAVEPVPPPQTDLYGKPYPALEGWSTRQSTEQGDPFVGFGCVAGGVFPDRISYFPAYEILLDELRDYRFYADDMLHPSPLAIDYIAEGFAQTYFDPETQKARQAWDKLRKAIAHRPLQPESEAYRQFITQTLLKLEQLKTKMPFFDISKEIETLTAKLR